MASHSYTYVPSRDPNREHIERRADEIQTMSFSDVKAHVRRLNEEVNACFTKFQKLLSAPTYDEMMERGAYWRDFAEFAKQNNLNANTIREISSLNLFRLTKELEGMHPRYLPLLQRIENFPWTMKHNTKPTYIKIIEKDRLLMSLTEIHRRGLGDQLKGGTTHEGLDDKMIHNEDFVFFRLSCGTEPAHSRFGSECLVFKPDQLFQLGWVSLHDMLSPASTDRMCKLPVFKSIEEVGKDKSALSPAVRTLTAPPMGLQYSYPETGETRLLHRAQIVFFGPDIRRGIACSVVNELLLMGGTKMLDLAMKYIGGEHEGVLLNLINNLFWIECKIPRFFLFAPHELLKLHHDVAYTKGMSNMM
jgi:hypothetical protein